MKTPTFQSGHSRNSRIHGFPSFTKDCMTSFQSCLQCRLVRGLPLRSGRCPGNCSSTAMNDKHKLLSGGWFMREQEEFLLGRHRMKEGRRWAGL